MPETHRAFYGILFTAIFICTVSSQTTAANPRVLYRGQPAADPDMLLSAYINPALLGAADYSALGFAFSFPEDSGFSANLSDVTGDYLLSANLGGLGISYEGLAGRDFWTLGLGFAVPGYSQLAFGVSDRFSAGGSGSAELAAGALWRPHGGISLGAVFRKETDGPWLLNPSIGIRPFAFTFREENGENSLRQRMLTFTADANIDKNGLTGDWYGLTSLSVMLEPASGFFLTGSYAVDGSFRVGMSTALLNSRNSFVTAFSPDKRYERITMFTSWESRPYPETEKPAASRIIEYKGTILLSETETRQKIGNFAILSPNRPFSQLTREIEMMAEDSSVAGILFTNPAIRGDSAHVNELYRALNKFRQNGKKVFFYFETANSATYALAAATADSIYLNPTGSVYIGSYISTSIFFKGFLDKAGIDVIGLETHPSKSAYHLFTRTGYTEESRKNLALFLDDIYNEHLKMIENGRKAVLKKDVREIMDDAPFLTAPAALESGLVDQLLFEDQIRENITGLYPNAKIVSAGNPVYAETRDPGWTGTVHPGIALIYATGGINTGEGIEGQNIGSDTLSRQIRAAREDRNIKAIILRISSGGGSALASDIIAREIYLTTRGTNPKPLVVSMGSVAASGGYYISAYADHIIAYPDTLTGSIGVTGFAVSINRLLDKWDIHVESVKTGESGGFLDPLKPLDPDDEKQIRDYMTFSYNRFVEIVADGRNMTVEDADEVARGQIWTGNQALERGLVDSLGGMAEALEKAKELASISGQADIIVQKSYDNLMELPAWATNILAKPSVHNGVILPEIEKLLGTVRHYKEMADPALRQYGIYAGLFLPPELMPENTF